MKKRRLIFGVLLILLALFQINVTAYGQAEMMPLEAVKAGMKGIGKTVIAGSKIETFDVAILSIVKGQSSVGDLILCRVSGPVIDQSGGIAAGMSGSPVYIDGKLVGAIGYSFSLTDHRLGLITPIQTMLKILELDQQTADPAQKIIPKKEEPKAGQTASLVSADCWGQLTEPVQIDGKAIAQVYFHHTVGPSAGPLSKDGTLVAYPTRTPLFISGIGGRALERLMTDLKRFDLVPITVGAGGADGQGDTPLEPGSAIAVQLVRGDVEVSALGTLSYRDADTFLAFGHPFLSTGEAEYFLSDAEIITVIDQQEMPYKLGVSGRPHGVVTQDRSAGIGGYFDRVPTIIPISIAVHDLDLDRTDEVDFQVVRDEELLTSLVVNAALQAVDTLIDRRGYGTSAVEVEILGDRLPDHMIRYSNMYYSPEDIAGASLGDLYSLLQVIVSNPFERVNVGSIKVKMDVMRTRQYAIVEEVKLLNQELRPGDTARIEVALRPYRGEPFTQVLEVRLPENLRPGSASLVVSGGIFGLYEQIEGETGKRQSGSNPDNSVVGEHYKSLDEVLQYYLKQPRNHELVVNLIQYPEESEGDALEEDKAVKVVSLKTEKDRDGSAGTSGKAFDQPIVVNETFWTEYVLEGSLQLGITILEPLDDETGFTDDETEQEEDSFEGNQVNGGD